jgi:hypothetical protein
MPPAAPLPPPDFDIVSAHPEVGWLRQAATAGDWPSIRQYVASLPPGTDRTFVVKAVGEVTGVEHPLRELVRAAPEDVLALTLLGTRLVEMGAEIRTAKRAEHVSREQFAAFHEHLRQAEPLLIRATALDPTFDPAWVERLSTAQGLQLGQNEARRRYDRLVAAHPGHFTGQARLLQQLCPKWGGDWDDAHAFAQECLRTAQPGTLNAGLLAELHLERWLDAGRGDKGAAYLRQPHVLAELVYAADCSVAHPAFRRTHGWVTVQGCFAALFALAGDQQRAAWHFRALGNLASNYPWGYLGNPAQSYTTYRDAALARG